MEAQVVAFDRAWCTGYREDARALAIDYVATHRAQLEKTLGGKTLEDLVKLVDGYRAAGRENERAIVDMWLLVEYQPQRIVGELRMGG